MYFGQKSEEHIKTITNIIWSSKTTIFDKDALRKKEVRFSLTFPALQGPGPGPYEPIRAHMGTYGPLWAHMDPKNPEKYI